MKNRNEVTIFVWKNLQWFNINIINGTTKLNNSRKTSHCIVDILHRSASTTNCGVKFHKITKILTLFIKLWENMVNYIIDEV